MFLNILIKGIILFKDNYSMIVEFNVVGYPDRAGACVITTRLSWCREGREGEQGLRGGESSGRGLRDVAPQCPRGFGQRSESSKASSLRPRYTSKRIQDGSKSHRITSETTRHGGAKGRLLANTRRPVNGPPFIFLYFFIIHVLFSPGFPGAPDSEFRKIRNFTLIRNKRRMIIYWK